MNAELLCFSSGSYLRNAEGKYCTGVVNITVFKVAETFPLKTTTSHQPAELYALTRAWTSARGKTADIYTDPINGLWGHV